MMPLLPLITPSGLDGRGVLRCRVSCTVESAELATLTVLGVDRVLEMEMEMEVEADLHGNGVRHRYRHRYHP